MPTPILIEGFEHKVVTSANAFGGAAEYGIWSFSEGTGFMSFPAGRNGACLQIAATGTGSRVIKHLNPTNVVVVSFYFKTTSAGVFNLAQLWTTGFALVPVIQMLASGQVRAQMADTTVDTVGSYNNGVWHRVDIRTNTSANPWVVDWQVDGVAQTSIQNTGVSPVMVDGVQLGGSSATYTCQWDDVVVSATSGDYPLGAHDVLFSVPTGDGTHVAGTNTIEANDGTDIVSPNAFPLLDEWPANLTDYIKQMIAGSGNYAEVTFADAPTGKTIWGVEATAALFSSNTGANNGTTRIVSSAGTTVLDVYTGDMSETSLNYIRGMVTDPGGGGWTKADYDGLKARVGFSTNVSASVPFWSALLLQYAVVDSGSSSVTQTHSTSAIVKKTATRTQSADARISGIATDDSDYITYTSTTLGDAASNFAEVTFEDATEPTIWAVQAVVAVESASSTGTNAGVTRIVDGSGATVVDIFSGDMSEDTTTTLVKLVPGTWTTSGLNALKARMGFATDTNPLPRWVAVQLQYATPEPTFTISQLTSAIVKKTATRLHSSDALIYKRSTRVQSANAIVLKTATRTHNTSAIILKTATRTHSTSAIVKKTATVTHSTDAIVKKTTTRVQSADARVLKTDNRSHATSAIILKTATKTHGTDALIYLRSTRVQAADAEVQRTQTRTQGVDTFIDIPGFVTQSVDAVIATLARTISHSTDADVQKTTTVAGSADAVVKKTLPVAQDQDAVVLSSRENHQYGDAIILVALGVTHESDGYVFGTGVPAHDTDAVVLATSSRTQDADTFVGTQPAAQQSADARIVEVTDWSDPVEGSPSVVGSVEHESDAYISLRPTLTHGADAVILKTETRTHLTNAVLTKTLTQTQSADAFIITTGLLAQDVDAVVGKTSTRDHETDARIQLTATRSHGSDAGIRSGFTQVQGADASVLRTIGLTHQTDADITKTSSRTQSASAVIRVGSSQAQSSDATITRTLSVSQQANAGVEKTFFRSQNADARILVSTSITQSSDSFIRATVRPTQQVDAIVEGGRTVSHSSGAIIEAVGTARSHVTDALIRGVIDTGQYVDADILKALRLTQAVDAIIEKAFTRTQNANALIDKPTVTWNQSDAVVRTRFVLTQSADANIQKTARPVHQTDADITKTSSCAQSADASIMFFVVQSADAFIQRASQHATDAVILKGRRKVQKADALIRRKRHTATGHESSHYSAIPFIYVARGHRSDAVID